MLPAVGGERERRAGGERGDERLPGWCREHQRDAILHDAPADVLDAHRERDERERESLATASGRGRGFARLRTGRPDEQAIGFHVRIGQQRQRHGARRMRQRVMQRLPGGGMHAQSDPAGLHPRRHPADPHVLLLAQQARVVARQGGDRRAAALPPGRARVVAIVASQGASTRVTPKSRATWALGAHERDGDQHGQRCLHAGHRLGSDVGDALGAGGPGVMRHRQVALVDALSLPVRWLDGHQELRHFACDVFGVLTARARHGEHHLLLTVAQQAVTHEGPAGQGPADPWRYRARTRSWPACRQAHRCAAGTTTARPGPHSCRTSC